MNKVRKILFAFVFIALMTFNINADDLLNPEGAIPEGKQKIGQVLVIVEDTIESDDPSIPSPRGSIIEGEWTDLYESDGMVNVIARAANKKDIQLDVGFGGNYISGIDGLSEFDRGYESGWMVTLNDWFISQGVGTVTTETTLTSEDGDLQDQDVIKMMYTVTGYGADLGGTWENNDKSLKDISFSQGVLNKEFSGDVKEYELELKKGTASILVTPTAFNKNFQCRVFVDDVEYRSSRAINVEENSIVRVTCGDPEWASMNYADDVDPVSYIFKIKYQEDQDNEDDDNDTPDQSDKIDKDQNDGDKTPNKESELPKTGQSLNLLYVILGGLFTSSGIYYVLRKKSSI